MKKVLLFALSLSLAATVSFTSCSDDDPSLREQFDYASDNYTDLMGSNLNAYPIYGKVKSIETKKYYATWNSATNKPSVLETDLYAKALTEYNKDGFIVKETTYGYPSDGWKVATVVDRTLDYKNRPVLDKTTTYTYGATPTTYVSREERVTYDDVNKKATVVNVPFDSDGNEGVAIKRVYNLLKNGRVDPSSYTEYTKAAGDDMNKPSYSKDWITDGLDSHKNWTILYRKDVYHTSNPVYTSISNYSTRDIVYY
ncbi:hypothetical protein [Dysgonomonas sp. 25]|uniref:hypothetical protein n=1 Tax=Dysgonomonas sp. 25 TaxID=2302933 RepID=UPI0013D6B869|nr:hypothetical protein [Dysgonomonas sp. 25]NDV67820.1 hypothetical protein [Dysgonomonas sp. 25]